MQQSGVEVNQNKSASNIEDEEVYGEKVDDAQGYKYLGILEDSRNLMKEENKTVIISKAIERTRMLCQKKLNAVNLFRGINEFALSTLNYYKSLLPFEPKEYEKVQEGEDDLKRVQGY